MYAVSDKYKRAIKRSAKQTRLKFIIEGTEYGEQYLLAGSFRLANQSTDTNKITLGSVYIGEMSATFMGVPIERTRWKNKKIRPVFSLKVDENEWEDVPLGVYTVTEATHSRLGVTVKASDDMRLFDKSATVAQASGKLFDYLTTACEACHVEMAQTEADLDLLPNGATEFLFFSDNDVQTWRDLLFWIAQTYGGFATINREGKLEIRVYGDTAVDSLTPTQRNEGGSFSDYVTKYTGLSYLDMAAKSTRYTGAIVDDGSTMALGGNPFLQYQTQAETAIENLLQAVANISYTPFKISTVTNPAYDLGDVIEFTEGIAGTACNCCLMSFSFVFRQVFTMAGYGEDPDKATALSKNDKNLSGLLAEANANEMAFYEYRNVRAINIGDNNLKQVLRLKLASKGKTRVSIHININLKTVATLEEPTTVTAEYMINGDIEALKPQETYIDGGHVLHLMYVLPMIENTITYFVLRLSAENGSIEIDRQGVWLFASGLGLVGDGTWDGLLDFEDIAVAWEIVECSFMVAQESVAINLITPTGDTLSDTASEYNITETLFDTAEEFMRMLVRYIAADRVLEDMETDRALEEEVAGEITYRATEEESG